MIEGQDYLPLKPIAELCEINYIFDKVHLRCILSTNEHKITLISDVNILKYDTSYLNIPFPPRIVEEEMYFPALMIGGILGTRLERLIFLKKIEEIPIIEKIDLTIRGDSTVLRFFWKTPVEFDLQFTPQQAIVELDGEYREKAKLKPKGAIKSLNIQPYQTYTRIELTLSDINACMERESEIVFYKKIAKKVELIVLDPGHGGIDPGAVGKNGLYEKDANLDIAKILKKFIEDSLKIRTMLTRDRDQYLSLKSRTNFANRNGADIFISIHCNASPRNRQARGFETYFLSEARTNEERAVAAMENASLVFDEEIKPSGDINFILYDLAQSLFLEESNNLAEAIQTKAEALLNIPARGVSQADFYVLRGAFMPAVLIECAFISNPEEERLLRDRKFKETIAHAIYSGLKDFIAHYERRLNH
ncbi:MAG: N-acetylmuramoyl-L-alanine amidase [candidate division WOR-3 bacterium]|nr:N-acetylmuramoyl-L-alanine amidase [candidate division WOR-3 bacterium]